MNNTSTNLAEALFALIRARDSLDAFLSSPPREERQKRYDEACERYEAAVVESCRARIQPVKRQAHSCDLPGCVACGNPPDD